MIASDSRSHVVVIGGGVDVGRGNDDGDAHQEVAERHVRVLLRVHASSRRLALDRRGDDSARIFGLRLNGQVAAVGAQDLDAVLGVELAIGVIRYRLNTQDLAGIHSRRKENGGSDDEDTEPETEHRDGTNIGVRWCKYIQ